MTCGIYLIIHKDTGQKYIGQSINIEKRWREHLNGSDINYSRVDRAINKHGADKFTLSVITELPNDRNLLDMHEKYWIKFYNTFKDKFHYNLTEGGGSLGSGENHPMWGRKHTPESREKMSKSHKGKIGYWSGKTGYFKGKKKKPFTDEHKQNLSKSMKGENNSRAKYNLWNINFVHYHKNNMFQDNRKPNPCKCFALKHNGKDVKIVYFHDFVSVEIIKNLIRGGL